MLAVIALALAATWQVDSAKSELTVHVFRAGALSASLHDHHFQPEQWRASASFDARAPGSVRVHLVAGAASLRDHQPELSRQDREEVERQVKSDAVLDARRFPRIELFADRLENPTVTRRKDGRVEIDGTLAGQLWLHGWRRRVAIPVHADVSRGRMHARGSVDLSLRDFGIHPPEKLLGAIAVKDRITIEFDVLANSAAGARSSRTF